MVSGREEKERKRELYRSYRGQSGAGLDGTCVYMKCIQLSEPHLYTDVLIGGVVLYIITLTQQCI